MSVLSAAQDVISAQCTELKSMVSVSDVVWQVLFYITMFWIVLEIGFLLVMEFFVLPNAQNLSKAHPYHGDMIQMMKRAVDLVNQLHCYDFKKYLSGFCRGAKFEDIYVENFRSFLGWAMYNKHLPELDESEQADLATVFDYAMQEHEVLRDMKPGFNPKVEHCRMTLDPIPIIHRPLLMYVAIRVKETIANAFYLPAMGFQFLEVEGLTYWYKHHGNQSAQSKSTGSTGSEPLLLLHGISTGWGFYLDMAQAIGQGRSIILVDMDAVKLNSLQFRMPTPQQFAERVTRILNRHNIERVSVLGHSFGSITAGWYVRQCPERVSHLTLIDPVSMLLSFPEVAYSFLYREPSTVMEWIIHVAAAREVTISHTLRRNFWWYNNDLWLENIPHHIGVVVGLATHDEIINPKALQEYVRNCRNARIAVLNGDAIPANTVAKSVRETNERSSALATAASFSDLSKLKQAPAPVVTKEVAMIECLIWDGFSHGQILMPSENLNVLCATVRSNEKVGTRSF